MLKKVSAIVAVLVLLAGIGGAWMRVRDLSKDPEVAKIEQMLDDVFVEAREKNLKHEDILARFQQVKEAATNLTVEQQKELKRSSSEAFQRMTDERIRTYMSLPEDKKKAFLDEEIDRKEALTARWKKDRKDSLDKGGQSGMGKWDNLTDKQWQEIKRQKLDRTTPEQRAMWDVFLRDFHKRRDERRLEAWDRGWK